MATQIDVTRAEALLATAVQDGLQQETVVQQSELQLKRLLGLPLPPPLRLVPVMLKREPPVEFSAMLEETALELRQDYQRARRLLDQTELEVKAARFNRLPALALTGSYGEASETPFNGDESTVWSADLGRQFAFISIIRRLLFIAALGLFWTTGSFLLFGVATTVIVIAFMAVLAGMLKGSAIWGLRSAPVTRGGIVAHWKRFWASLVFALSELFVLNSPYAVVTVLLGVGPALVMFDSVMKVCRLAMAGTRTLAEIFLPRISRQLLGGEMPQARRGLFLVIALCVAASAVPALAVMLFGQQIFDLLLGQNNVVPPAATPVA